jgi:thymidylate kinase
MQQIEPKASPSGPAKRRGSPVPKVAKQRGADTPNGRTTLHLISRLRDELAAAGVRYCHWKSNEALDRSASGENDLDLLVSREDLGKFREILSRLGFKDARAPRAKELPGIFQAYGLDPESGVLVNVHAHIQLVLGDDTTKNYRLPIEVPYLASATETWFMPTPAPEFEYVVFVVRMLLKHATWDAKLMLSGGLAGSEQRELAYLEDRIDETRVRAVVREHLPWLDDALWDRCVRAVRAGASAAFRMRTAGRLIRALGPHGRRPRATDTALRVTRRVTWGVRRYVFRRRQRKTLAHGGALVALVGGDGAGKSSAVEGLASWLGRVFLTKRVHLGKPPRSLSTLAFKVPIAVARKVGLFTNTRLQAYELPADGSFPGYAWLVWGLLTARDRLREYRRARRLALSGAIVICDRYPVPFIKLMDGSRTASLANVESLGRVARYLARLERRYYDRVMLPEVLIVLRVDPEVAVARKPEEEVAFVRARSTEIWSSGWSETPALVVDSSRPQQAVLDEIKSLVWSRI